MSLLVINNLTLRIAGRPLLEGASLNIDPGRKVGLVGRNGVGKSTLLAAIAGDIAPDDGTITLSNRATMGRVKQETPSGDQSLLETVLASDEERTALLHQAETIHNPHDLAEIHERLLAIDAYTAPTRASIILAGLGFSQEAQQRAVSDFSGGWRMRVALASALFLAPDLLLLDEPTNHLDIEATLWLENWLIKYPGAVLMVSHDRSLLDNTVQAIAHLDQGKLSLTPGGYDRFIQIKTEQALQQNRAAEKISQQRAKMESFVARFRAKATKARQAQARLKALAKLPQIESVIEATPTTFSFPEPQILPPPMIRLENVAVGYDGKAILSNLNLRLDMQDRIALLGQNGHGKSTFAKLLAGRLEPLKGDFAANPRLKVGYFAQHQSEELIAQNSPIDHMAHALPKATQTEIRAQLARFGLDSERAETAVGSLSGGEKARLVLALATRHAPHLLLLDEPTNHLDLDARDALIRALCEFEGAVILISHDSYLVESVADDLWIAENGTITPFQGDMGDYKNWLENRARRAQTESSPNTVKKISDNAQKRVTQKEKTKLLAPIRRKIKEAESRITKLTEAKKRLEEKLASPSLYVSGKNDDIVNLNSELAQITDKLEQTELEWFEAQDELEKSDN
ncbi:ATP-binding cassette domain-containing protein [Aristophania vespae]|uniref:ATP-binding cassette domain-containing protein n=1 Tax=Aristophania vespae TaxID=2697033 RepID=A0A6P1ND71_9PROT|nr:ABC-F family ATP-binding cassette domain-containing protein [Aristophania vespae]QHI95409.1 ATP-binding cassette domain-containing protein [Aristophania vespae]